MTRSIAPRAGISGLLAILIACVCAQAAASAAAASASPDSAAADSVDRSAVDDPTLPSVTVTGHPQAPGSESFPGPSASISQAQIQETVNSVDAEDAVKYLPSLFIRKRNYGDTQPVIATRDWGVNSSARILVYVDDIPISALINNNNTIGAPRWGMVSPEEIDHVNMLYGPYSAEYSGSSMGGVLQIVTRQPSQTEVTLEQTGAVQSFGLYDTHDDYPTSETSLTAGGSRGAFSWFVAGSFLESASQPLAFVTASSPPAGTAGAIPAANKLGQPADVLGAAGLLHRHQTSWLARAGYDLTPVWHLTQLIGFWRNDEDSQVATYIAAPGGSATYGGAGGFASNDYALRESHLMTGLSLKSASHTAWDGEAVLTYYGFLQDQQRSPAGVTTGTAFTPNGLLADYGGTQWGTLDLKGIWRPFFTGGTDSSAGPHEISFGAHADRYVLDNPTFSTSEWQDAGSAQGLYASSRGRTQTQALWLQDVWRPAAAWQATVGARLERWRASEGYNFSGHVAVTQPSESASGFSPKASVRWQPAADWSLTGSVARSVRFPTVGELYQLVSTGSTFASPNPDLAPERDTSGELAVERTAAAGSARLSFFQENTSSALISQTSTLPGYPVPVTYVQNVGEIRNRGIELAVQQALSSVQLNGSVTYVDSTILSDPGFASTTGSTAEGKRAPYVPRWRATLEASYRPAERWAFTLAGRYSGQMYSTLDNSDNTAHVFGAFDSFLVLDARVHWDATSQLSLSAGVDNLTNRLYFIYHPFPQRTFVADLHLKLR